MTVREIIEQYLKENGYDGLYCPIYGECACVVGDLMPCDNDCSECEPGYRHPGDSDSDFYIKEEKFKPREDDRCEDCEEREKCIGGFCLKEIRPEGEGE